MREIWLANGLTGELGSQILPPFQRLPLLELKPLDLSLRVQARRILHLAARRPVHTPRQLIESNLFYLRRVLKYAEENSIPEFVFFSTASLYQASNSRLIKETDVSFPWRDLYSWTKWAGEKMVRMAKIRSKLILRLPGVLEMRSQTNFISRAYQAIRTDGQLQCTHLTKNFNRLISAEEVVRFLLHTQGALKEGTQVVNLAPEATHTLQEHLEEIGRVLNREVKAVDGVGSSAHAVIDVSTLMHAFAFQPEGSLTMVRNWAASRAAVKG